MEPPMRSALPTCRPVCTREGRCRPCGGGAHHGAHQGQAYQGVRHWLEASLDGEGRGRCLVATRCCGACPRAVLCTREHSMAHAECPNGGAREPKLNGNGHLAVDSRGRHSLYELPGRAGVESQAETMETSGHATGLEFQES